MPKLTDEQILKAAIEQAHINGFKQSWADLNHIHIDVLYPQIIFSHDFAKAFFPDMNCPHDVWTDGGAIYRVVTCSRCGAQGQTPEAMKVQKVKLFDWKDGLKQMVIEEKPLQYLAQFLPKQSASGAENE